MKFFKYWTPSENYWKIKDLEDQLASLVDVHQNVSVFIFYTGLLYGGNQVDLKDTFKKAFLQQDIKFGNISGSYKIPLFNVE